MQPGEVRLEVGDRVRMLSLGAQWKQVAGISRTFVDFGGGNLVSRRLMERLIATGRVEVEAAADHAAARS